MKHSCPHCNVEFELTVDDEQELDAAVPCPTCGEQIPTGPQSSINIDVDFELDSPDELDEAMTDTTGPIPESLNDATGPIPESLNDATGPIPESLSDVTGPIPESLNDVTGPIEDLPESTPEATSEASDTTVNELEISDSESLAEITGMGFDVEQEVSKLADVNLNMPGTYHRTGRVLHHATDVIWTGKPRKVSDKTSTDEESGTAATETGGKAITETMADEDLVVATPPPVPSGPPPVPSAPPPTVAPPEEPVEESIDDLLDIPAAPEPEEPATPPDSNSSEDAEEFTDDPFDIFELEDAEINAPAGEEQAEPTDSAPKLEEMDFTSLLDSKSGSHSGLFDNDSNPFNELNLDDDDGGDELSSLLGDLDLSSSPDSYESDNETMTFFIDAPDAQPESNDPLELDLGGGAYDMELPADMDSAGGPQPQRPERPERMPRPPKSGKPNLTIAVAGALIVVLAAGVGSKALGFGWFFMDLLEDENSKQMARPVAPVNPVLVKAKKPVLTEVADSFGAYKVAITQTEQKLKTKPQDKLLKEKLSTLQLRYRYRWPGRYERDETLENAVQQATAGELSAESRFWNIMGGLPPDGPDRAKLMGQAKVALAQVDVATLPKGRKLLFDALLLHEAGERDSAIQLLETLFTRNPNDQWALFLQGQLLLKSKQYDEADIKLSHLLEQLPSHIDGRLLQAQVAIARGTDEAYARARDYAEKAYEMTAASKDAYGEYQANLVRAVVYGRLNDLKARLKALEGAAKFDPRDESLLLELAENDLKKGDAKNAVKRLQDCAKGVCTSIRYYKTHIKALFINHQLTEAASKALEADIAHPGIADLIFWSAKILEAQGRLTMAAVKYEAVKNKDSRYLEAYLRLAGIHRRKKNFNAAIKVLDEASRAFTAGKDTEAGLALLQERGELLVRQERLDKAREVFGKILAAQSTNAPARFRLARILTQLGYPLKAVGHFEKLYAQGWNDPEVNIHFAEALIRSGKPDRAIEELKSFLEGNPNSLEGLVKLGHAFVQKQRYEEAMAVLERAVAIEPEHAPAYYFAGMAEIGRQRLRAQEVERKQRNGEVVSADEKPAFKKAIIALTTARKKSPDKLEYRELLAQALTESGKEQHLVTALEQYDHIIKAYRTSSRAGKPIKRKASVYYSRGLLASKLGQPRPRILKNFEDALSLDSSRADFIARYAEELFRLQVRSKVAGRHVLEAKAYFMLILNKHNANHVRANFYMGRILLNEWDKQRNRRPGDALHNRAQTHFENVVKHNGADDFPEAMMEIGNILRDRSMHRLSRKYYQKYLATYRRVKRRDPPNARYVRELMRKHKAP